MLELAGNLFRREAWRALVRNRLRSVLAIDGRKEAGAGNYRRPRRWTSVDYAPSSNFWMPAANQPPAGAARISSTGVLHEAGGAGDSTSLIVKLPSAERSTGLVLRWVKGAAFSQTSVAKT